MSHEQTNNPDCLSDKANEQTNETMQTQGISLDNPTLFLNLTSQQLFTLLEQFPEFKQTLFNLIANFLNDKRYHKGVDYLSDQFTKILNGRTSDAWGTNSITEADKAMIKQWCDQYFITQAGIQMQQTLDQGLATFKEQLSQNSGKLLNQSLDYVLTKKIDALLVKKEKELQELLIQPKNQQRLSQLIQGANHA